MPTMIGDQASSTRPASASPFANSPTDKIAGYFFTHNDAHRVNTDAYIYDAIKHRHPGLNLTVVPEHNANLVAFAGANPSIASIKPVHKTTPGDVDLSCPTAGFTKDDSPKPPHKWPSSLKWTFYRAPTYRLSGPGQLVEETFFDSFIYSYKSVECLVYFVDGRDGTSPYPQVRNQYILAPSPGPVYDMIREIGKWSATLHDEIWVFNQGFWDKDAGLYAAIEKARWEDVILPDDLKTELMDVATRFFSEKTQKTYHRLRVPWKRGIIFYGPPGNGKTISIKATMHSLYHLHGPLGPIPTLYVKTLASFAGPEYSINVIFEKARSYAPCYLVFEDLDSLVTPAVRSFFLNAVDGVSENEGILMVGSTNHLDQLDEGISKRPSRFDRKYEFGPPNEAMRKQYCQFWQRKLKADEGVEKDEGGGGDEQIEFPDVLVGKIAGITKGFSFAYMQEAFVSALLVIAGKEEGKIASDTFGQVDGDDPAVDEAREAFEVIDLEGSVDKEKQDEHDGDEKDPLDKYVLWREIKVQVAMLKKEMGEVNL